MSKNNYRALLELMIDKSSLSKIQKQLAKENLKINTELKITGTEQLNKLSGNLSGLIKASSDATKALQAISNSAKSIEELNTTYRDITQSVSSSKAEFNAVTTEILNQAKAWANLNNEISKSTESSNAKLTSISSNAKNLVGGLNNALTPMASIATMYSGLDIFRNKSNENFA